MRLINRFLLVLVAVGISGCASYRTSSNVEDSGQKILASEQIQVLPSGSLLSRAHQIVRRIEVSIKKLTIFHADPTKDQANAELRKKAMILGCDAVANVQYQSGIGLTTWGYIDAQGDCVKFR